MLLTWTTTLFSRQTDAAHSQLAILREWANSGDGKNLYSDLARSAQGSQSVEQLALVMSAMLGYSRLVPDHFDHLDCSFNESYLADLDAHLGGHTLGNRGTVTEHMVFAMIRVLSTFKGKYEDLVAFLVAVLDREPPILHPFAGLSDQYLMWRIGRCGHDNAFYIAMMEVSRSLPESVSTFSAFLRADADPYRANLEHLHGIRVNQMVEESYAANTTEDTVPSYFATAFSSGAHRRFAALNYPPCQYQFTRLSQIEDKDVWGFFNKNAGRVDEVPSIVLLGDGSYEIVVLSSHCNTLRSQLDAFLPGSELELEYDPTQPTDADLNEWGYLRAKTMSGEWFSERAWREIGEGWPLAAAYYAYRLGLISCCPIANPGVKIVAGKPSIPTFGG